MKSIPKRMLVLFGVGVMILPISAAAASLDTIVPTQSYDVPCFSHSTPNGDSLCQTDNAGTSYYRQGSTTSTTDTAIHATMNNSFQGTALTINETSSPVYSGSGETDIIYQQSTSGFSGSVIGMTWCNNAAGGTYKCDQTYVRFRYSADRALACHETGHAVGLTHGHQAYPYTSNSANVLGCMVTPEESAQQYLGTTNVDNINIVY